MCQVWTLNPPSCLARLVRSNSPRAWWSCPRGRMWAKRCGRKSIKLLGCPPRTTELVLLLWGRTIYFGWFVLCSASLHNCIWKCSRCFVVQQVWSSEKCNFQKLDIFVFLSLTISSAKTVSSPCFRNRQTDRQTDVFHTTEEECHLCQSWSWFSMTGVHALHYSAVWNSLWCSDIYQIPSDEIVSEWEYRIRMGDFISASAWGETTSTQTEIILESEMTNGDHE